jgi:hypothetical protein
VILLYKTHAKMKESVTGNVARRSKMNVGRQIGCGHSQREAANGIQISNVVELATGLLWWRRLATR